MLGLAVRSRYEWLRFEDVYATSAWASILVSAGVVEWFVVHRTLKPLARRPRPRGTPAVTPGGATTIPRTGRIPA
ncbi:hypothetical protein AB852_08845 [Streptomyces uncialis]|uniref:Uncharacterized protein n=2 Tax=Streptomyces uncialis TaxID=1048205 RepID=A0A1Q4V979_9ACTN|nr:hypothetical protein AB852_08845 [Streptomyces uncialis]